MPAPLLETPRRVHSYLPHGERAAAMVEFALCLPVLILLAGAVFGVGLAMHERITLTRVVRYTATEAVKRNAICVNSGGAPSISGDFREFAGASGLTPDHFTLNVEFLPVIVNGAAFRHQLLRISAEATNSVPAWFGVPQFIRPKASVQFMNVRDLPLIGAC